jgi:hypothetical protein
MHAHAAGRVMLSHRLCRVPLALLELVDEQCRAARDPSPQLERGRPLSPGLRRNTSPPAAEDAIPDGCWWNPRRVRHVDFPPADRPEVEVLVDETWSPGELRAWSQPRPGGRWYAHVSYRTDTGERYTATMRSDRVRKADPPVG